MQVIKASTPLWKFPGGAMETELLFGEQFEIDAVHVGYYSGRTVIDNYPGYVRKKDLCDELLIPTHRVRVPYTWAYKNPNFKSPSASGLFMNSLVHLADGKHSVEETPEGTMLLISGAGWVFERHLIPITQFASDHVDVALHFLRTLYGWGGKTCNGIDCSGLTQTALLACGITVPRNSSEQEQYGIGESIAVTETLDKLKRGDFVFFQGHVGIMVGPKRILHATADHMAVVDEGIWTVVERRLSKGKGGVTSIKRLT